MHDEAKTREQLLSELFELRERVSALEKERVERKRTEEALREGEERFRSLVETTSDWIWEIDAQARYTYCSPKVREILGYAPEEFIGRTPFDFMPQDEAGRIETAFEQILVERRCFYLLENVNLHRDGRHVVLETSGVPFFTPGGEFAGFRGMDRDITARKHVEQRLREYQKEEKLRNINRTLRALSNTIRATIHASDVSDLMKAVCRIIVNDCDHPMVWIGFAENDENKTVRVVAQSGLEEDYTRNLKITWSNTELGRGPAGTAIRTGSPDICRNMSTDPRMRPWREQLLMRGYASAVSLPLNATDVTLGVLTIYSKEPDFFSEDEVKLLAELADNLAFGITALRLRLAHQEREKELRENRTRLDLALRSAGMGTWHWDIPTNTSYFDEQACHLLGIDPARFNGTQDEIYRCIHADDREKIRKALARTIERDVQFDAEHRVEQPDGRITHVVARGKLVRDDQGRPERLNGLIWDITGRKRIEEELRQSHDELELRVKERTADLEAAYEKLRLIPSRLIEAQEEERRRLAAELHDSIGQTLAALKFRIEHILAIFRDRKTKEALRLAEEFIPILQRSMDEARSIYMGLRPKVLEDFGAVAALRWYRDELINLYPQLHIEMDITIEEFEVPDNLVVPIFRIAQEALNNVCKHSHTEWADVRLAINAGTIELEISDDGTGMDLDYILKSSTAKSLGLIAMSERVDLTGGEFTITSSPGEGTTVRARWPHKHNVPVEEQSRKISY
ncbi:MAG: PAS domain S-box protein [Syntrophobacteraceae bacterium]